MFNGVYFSFFSQSMTIHMSLSPILFLSRKNKENDDISKKAPHQKKGNYELFHNERFARIRHSPREYTG